MNRTRRSSSAVTLVAVLVGLTLFPGERSARAESVARFALVIGVNQSADPTEPVLRYADDDAALYFELFRSLGARAYLVTRLDNNTRRLHPQAAAEASAPRRTAFEQTLAQLQADVARAQGEHVRTLLYIVYAGHGSVVDGQGRIALEDAQLTGADLAQFIDRSAADEAHVIIDACYSFYLAYPRGPGGRRRPIGGLRRLGPLAESNRVGLLLSTSSARESHEWEGFQAGVFSHEVRSGLLGAADADGDGSVSYREIAAFVERANVAIPNERFRPDLYARPPQKSELLLDLRPALDRHVVVPGGAHFVLENVDGVRLADLHGAPGHQSRLARPTLGAPLYLREAGSALEFQIPAAPDRVALSMLEPGVAHVAERGAAHQAYSQLFTRPFDAGVVAAYQFRPLFDASVEERVEARQVRRRTAGLVQLTLAGATLVTGAALSFSALVLRDANAQGLSQAQVFSQNAEIARRNLGAAILYGTTAALVVSGAALLIAPRLASRRALALAVHPSGGAIEWAGAF